MSQVITIDQAKLFLRVDHSEEDELIEGFINSALEACENHIGKPLSELGNEVPQTIRQAAFFLIGHYYSNRSAVIVGTSTNELPMAVESLLNPHRDHPFT